MAEIVDFFDHWVERFWERFPDDRFDFSRLGTMKPIAAESTLESFRLPWNGSPDNFVFNFHTSSTSAAA
jgi:hypothetical protein